MLELNSDTTVRNLLTTYPEVFDVLLSHGMCEDCQRNPPPVPLGHFANKHCGGDLDNLIAELRTTIESPVT